jgi:hypothetical protein
VLSASQMPLKSGLPASRRGAESAPAEAAEARVALCVPIQKTPASTTAAVRAIAQRARQLSIFETSLLKERLYHVGAK